MTDTNCCHFTLYMETLEQVSIFTLYRKTLSPLKLFPGRWSVLTCLDVCRCGTYLSFFCEYTKASGHRKRVPGLETCWDHHGWEPIGLCNVWGCLGLFGIAGAVPLHGHHGPGIVPMDSNGYQWYSWWGIAFSQVSPCSVSFVSFASFLMPEVFLAVTERINDSIKLCIFSGVFGAGLCSLLSIVGHGCLADDRASVSVHLQDSGLVTVSHKASEITWNHNDIPGFSHSWRDGEMSEAFWSRSSRGHAWSWTTASTTSSWSTICWFLLSHCSLHRCGMVCDCLRCKWARSNSITQYSSAQLYKFHRNPCWFFNFHVVAVTNISHSCRDLQSPLHAIHIIQNRFKLL